ncbi:hypothetical protein HN588_16785 [Candidatus Bathyarchaeota archaeon]|jgi:hypothetical protein|nr:hypothetical protein [Candidatus Bathyarchaeota archaeon]
MLDMNKSQSINFVIREGLYNFGKWATASEAFSMVKDELPYTQGQITTKLNAMGKRGAILSRLEEDGSVMYKFKGHSVARKKEPAPEPYDKLMWMIHAARWTA